ncbi:MAG: YHYH protein [Halioglobus sp.]
MNYKKALSWLATCAIVVPLLAGCIGNRNAGDLEAKLYRWDQRDQPLVTRKTGTSSAFAGYFRGAIVLTDLLIAYPELDTTAGTPYLLELCEDDECQYVVAFPEAFDLTKSNTLSGFAVMNPITTALYYEVENMPADSVRGQLDLLAESILSGEAPYTEDGVIDYLDILKLDYELETQYIGLFIDPSLPNVASVASRYDSGISFSEILSLAYDPGVVDISSEIFVDTSGDCAYYALSYGSAVSDVRQGTDFEGMVEISFDSNSCLLSSNGIPNHDFQDAGARFATTVSEQSIVVNIPRMPAKAPVTTSLSQRSYDAIMLNGVALDLLSAGCYQPDSPQADADGNTPIGCNQNDGWLLDPMYAESTFSTDSHNAHSQPNGLYHYHGNPVAMFDDNPGANGSPTIGFAADGFPVYGSYFYDENLQTVRKAQSGYTLREGSRPSSASDPGGVYNGTYIDDYEFTNAGDLDECNGMTIDGQYGYYVTDAYPWVLNCYAGTPDDSFSK